MKTLYELVEFSRNCVRTVFLEMGVYVVFDVSIACYKYYFYCHFFHFCVLYAIL